MPIDFKPLYRLHNCRWAFPIAEGKVRTRGLSLKWKTVHMKGWNCYYGSTLKVAYRFLPVKNTIEIYGIGLRGNDYDALERQSLLEAVDFSHYLEGVLKVKFGPPQKACRFHIAILNDPIAAIIAKKYTGSIGDVWVDASFGQPELEFRDKRLLPSYLFMINNFPSVFEAVLKIPQLLENQEKLGAQFQNLAEQLNQSQRPRTPDIERLYR